MLIVAIFFSLKNAVGLLDEALQRKAKLTLSFQIKALLNKVYKLLEF